MTTADELRAAARRARQDADALRALAAGLDRSVIHDLTTLAGDRTWVGPTAARLEQAVRTARHELDEAAAALRRDASRCSTTRPPTWIVSPPAPSWPWCRKR